jgi:hypothetical protein
MKIRIFIFTFLLSSFFCNAQKNDLCIKELENLLNVKEFSLVTRELLVIHNLTFHVNKFEYHSFPITYYIESGLPSKIDYPTLYGFLFKTDKGYLLFDGLKKITESKRVILFDSNFCAQAVYHFTEGNLIAISIFEKNKIDIKEKICLANNNWKVYPLGELKINEISNFQYALDLFSLLEKPSNLLNKSFFRYWKEEDYNVNYFLFIE